MAALVRSRAGRRIVGRMRCRTQDGCITHLDIVIVPVITVQIRAPRKDLQEPYVHAFLQRRVIQDDLHLEAYTRLGEPNIVDFVKGVFETGWTPPALSQMDPKRDSKDRTEGKDGDDGTVDWGLGVLQEGLVFRYGVAGQDTREKTECEKKCIGSSVADSAPEIIIRIGHRSTACQRIGYYSVMLTPLRRLLQQENVAHAVIGINLEDAVP